MYVVVPLKDTKLHKGWTYYLSLNWINPDASIYPDTSKKYVVLGYKKTGL